MAHWSDLIDFDESTVLTSTDAAEAIGARL